MNEQDTNDTNADAPQEPTCNCSFARVARTVIGTLLLTVMLGNLAVFASPRWAASIGSYLPQSWSSSGGCSKSRCSSGRCCSDMTAIGLPASVLESVQPTPIELEDIAIEPQLYAPTE